MFIISVATMVWIVGMADKEPKKDSQTTENDGTIIYLYGYTKHGKKIWNRVCKLSFSIA